MSSEEKPTTRKEEAVEVFVHAIGQSAAAILQSVLDERRAASKFTQQDLAEFTGVNRSTVSRWLSGDPMHVSHLVQLMTILQCEFHHFEKAPHWEDRLIEGYMACIQFLRPKHQQRKPKRSWTKNTFHLIRVSAVCVNTAGGDASKISDEELEDIRRDYLDASNDRKTAVTRELLDQLSKEGWHKAWNECRDFIKHKNGPY